MEAYRAGIALRGEWIDDHVIAFGGRGVGISFLSPDPAHYVSRLALSAPGTLADLYELAFDDVLDYLDQLSRQLRLDRNPYLQQALEASCATSSQTPPLLRHTYEFLPQLFSVRHAREMAARAVGIDYLNGWVAETLDDGRRVSVRAFGARTLHIIAGNSPLVAALTIVRNILTRSDAIIKSPSNDPFTALAIARSMIDMAPDHPLTRHLSVAYWKGGDEAIEQQLYRPQNLEKIVAWGGLASVRHVTRYIQPGLELISLDPKRSASIIGPEAFADERTERDVAVRLATDIGAMNQEACVNARVVYVQSGTDEAGLRRLNRLAQRTYEAMLALPQSVSTPPKHMSPTLRRMVQAAGLNDEWFHVVGGQDEGAVIASQLPEPVDFSDSLGNRVANLVPFDDIDEVCARVDAYTQTIGVYPEALKHRLRDRLALYGAQRFTSLGYAAYPTFSTPQDGIEPMRRLCQRIVCEDCDPDRTPPLWSATTRAPSKPVELPISQ